MKLGWISILSPCLTIPVFCWTMSVTTGTAQEKTESFPETRRGFVKEFDSPKDLDPFIPVVEVNRMLPDRLTFLWLSAFKRDEQDLKRLVAESIADAHRGGENLDETILPLLAEFSRPGSSRLTQEAVAGALVELDAKQAADAFYENAGQASWTLSEIIEPALANWQDQRMEAVWLERLRPEFSDKGRQRLAIKCLRMIRSPKAVAALGAIAQSNFTSASLRIAAAEALSEIGEATNVELAQALVSQPRGSRTDRLAAARVLRKQSGTSASDMLMKLAKDEETSVQSVAAQHLCEINPQLVKPLATELADSPNANVRELAVQALAHESAEADIHKLIELLADHHPPVRQAAREALESMAQNGEFDDLIDGAMIEIARTAHTDTDWRQLEQAIVYLGELDRKQAAPLLIRHLPSHRNQVFLPAAWALRKLSVKETFEDCLLFIDRAVAQLGSQLADSYLDAQLSQLCQMYGINQYEPAGEVLKTFIPKAVKNRGTQTRAAAIWSLGHIYEDRPQPDLAALLVKRLNDVDINNPELFEVRAASAVAIARMGHQEKLAELRAWLKSDTVRSPIGYSCAWGIRHLTDEPIPVLEPVNQKKSGWFLFPISNF